MIVLGVASLTVKGEQIEYRVIVHRFSEQQRKDRNWWHSDPLITRPVDQPFDGISILFPEGDSVVLGLHDLSRARSGDEGDNIESHFFVDHCPWGSADGKLNIAGTAHYASLVDRGRSAPALIAPRPAEQE
jgi:hypothetical protein